MSFGVALAQQALENSGAVAFWSALAGAGVGGFAAAIGSVYVDRRKATRQARIRMYDELLPEILRPKGVPLSGEDLAPLHRVARISGWRDRRAVEHIMRLHDESSMASEKGRAEWVALGKPQGWSSSSANDAYRALRRSIEEFADALGKRIR
jgi:hypothetical protein